MAKKLENIRVFNKKAYRRLSGTHRTSEIAESVAEHIRKKGNRATVVEHASGFHVYFRSGLRDNKK